MVYAKKDRLWICGQLPTPGMFRLSDDKVLAVKFRDTPSTRAYAAKHGIVLIK